MREGSALEAFLFDDVQLQVLSQLGEWAAPRADRNRDRRQLVFVDEAQAGQRLGEVGAAVDQDRPFVVPSLQVRDLRAQVPAEDLGRSPFRLLQGVGEDGLRLLVHRGCDRPLGRGPVRAHDLVAAAAHRVDAGLLERAAVPLTRVVAEPLEHPFMGPVGAGGKTVEGHDHLENYFSIAHVGRDLPPRVNSSPIGAAAAAQASSPSSRARCAASTRERQSSLRRMLRTCMSTVRGLRKSSCGDLAVRAADARPAARPRARAATGRRPRRRPRRGAEPLLDRLAERRDLARGLGRQRARAELARRAVGARRGARAPASRSPAAASATPARSSICARSNGMSRPRCSSTRAARAARRRSSGVALEQRGLADRVRERGERVGVPGRGRDPASAPRRRRARRRGRRGRAKKPAAQRRPQTRVVVVLAALPALEQRAAVLGAPRRRRPRRPRRSASAAVAVDAHVVVAERADATRSDDAEQPPRRRELALEAVDRRRAGPRRPTTRASPAAISSRLSSPAARPLAALAQHVDHAGDAARPRCPRRRRSGRGRARCRAPPRRGGSRPTS